MEMRDDGVAVAYGSQQLKAFPGLDLHHICVLRKLNAGNNSLTAKQMSRKRRAAPYRLSGHTAVGLINYRRRVGPQSSNDERPVHWSIGQTLLD